MGYLVGERSTYDGMVTGHDPTVKPGIVVGGDELFGFGLRSSPDRDAILVVGEGQSAEGKGVWKVDRSEGNNHCLMLV